MNLQKAKHEDEKKTHLTNKTHKGFKEKVQF